MNSYLCFLMACGIMRREDGDGMEYEQGIIAVLGIAAVIVVVVCAVGIFLLFRKWSHQVADRLFGKREGIADQGKERESIWHMLAPSLMGIVLCVVCLCGTSWAWFTVSRSSSVTPIQTANYIVGLTVDGEAVPQTLDGNSILTMQLSAGQAYQVALKANGTASTGYCKVTFEGHTYYTDQIGKDDTLAFTVNASQDSTMEIESQWGTCALASVDKIAAGAVIGEELVQTEETEASTEEADVEEEESESDTGTIEEETMEIEESETEMESAEQDDMPDAEDAAEMNALEDQEQSVD